MQRQGNETGTVIEVTGSMATVMIDKSKSCKECGKAQAGICGKSGAGMIMKVKNPLNAVKGATVTLGLEKKIQGKGYFLAFILPVLSLFAGTYAGQFISSSTGIKGLDMIAGITFLVLSVIYSLFRIHKLDKSAEFYITAIVNQRPETAATSCPEEMDYMAGFNGRA